MAVWKADNQDPGFNLVQDGFVSKFLSRNVLDDAIWTLQAAGYRIVRLDAGSWADESAMHQSFSTALQFPGYYGRNLDALVDCLGDVAELDYGWAESETGLVVVIDNFDHFRSAMPEVAVTVLDIISGAALRGALLGNRVLCLIRSDDPWLEIGAIGGYSPRWNPREWRNADRLDQ
ncbi:barstar family protein [Leifsonia sp. NPDC056665]|uniref:barstar family protein n=1 Tax=Leifsonia sp. NPDC056665 TaxID=3345901 RepID=UPI0036B1B6CD